MALPKEQKALFITKSNGEISTLKDSISNNSTFDPANNYFTFIDASHAKNTYNWSLKNILVLLIQNKHFKHLIGKTITLIALRVSRIDKNLTLNKSEILKVQLPETCGDSGWVGWERNDRGNMGPRMTNMKSAMDPKQ